MEGGKSFIFQSAFRCNLRLTKGRVDLGRTPLSRRPQEESTIQSGKMGGGVQRISVDAHKAAIEICQSAVPRPACAAPF